MGLCVINHPPRAYNDAEELILIKEGNIQVTINDTTVVLGPASLYLSLPVTNRVLTHFDKAVAYYVLTFKGRTRQSSPRKARWWFFYKRLKDLAHKTDKGESRQIFDRPSSMFERFDMHATNLNAGMISHPPHTHRAEEIILMIKGDVQMQIGEIL